MNGYASTLVLDFGGVISRTLFETHSLTEQALGLPSGTLQWRGPFDPSTDPFWRQMQAQEITERQYWQTRAAEVGQMVGQNWTQMQQFVKEARGADPLPVIRPQALAAIEIAKKAGRKLAILSNELDLFYGAEFRGKIPALADFDLIVDATYTEILKPDQRAYSIVTETLGVSASDCVFVDDQQKNIAGGEAAGMRCVWFDVMDPAGSYDQALNLLGLAPLTEH